MDLNGIPLFSLLQNKLGYLSERQKMIAQNVANASTPGFTPSDLRPFDHQPGVDPKAGASLVTEPAKASAGVSLGDPVSTHRQAAQSKKYTAMATPDSETTLNGNQVVLEEQMLKMSESRTDYDAAIGFYQKSLGLLHLAIRKPGG